MKPPKALEQIADVVLNYRPSPGAEAAQAQKGGEAG